MTGVGDLGNGTVERQGVAAIRDRLREAIVTGELGPDTISTQTQLADAFGVSRTPMREALRMLELEGLIVRETNRRFRIAGFSLDDLEELYVMRLSLEVSALRLTLPKFTHATHAELEGFLAQMKRFALVSDVFGFEEPHRRFHMRLVEGAGSRVAEQIRRLWDHAARYRFAYAVIVSPKDHGGYAVRRNEHRALLDAVEGGDTEAATKILASHYARTALDIAQRVDPDNGMDRLRTILEAHTGSRDLISVSVTD
jgi:GntR family transcriptional regulator, rspAB operon transcriptional repressor